MNGLYFRILWPLTAPVRAYLRTSPLRRGRGRIASLFVYPVLRLADEERTYRWVSATGAEFHLRFREEIGGSIAAFGSFEHAELASLIRRVDEAFAYDVGANIGIFTVPMATRIGSSARVVAFEPYPPNIARLRSHLALNRVSNVDILPVAVGDVDGNVELRVGSEPARATTATGNATSRDGLTLSVPCRSLDSVWDESGRPKVAAIKIDVEGSEVAVVRGASRLIDATRPALMIESVDSVESLERMLRPYGYRRTQPNGFMPWNHLFTVSA